MTPTQFDRADFVEGWRYELIKEVLVVSPIPLESKRDPNEELGYLLRTYRDSHPKGWCLDGTLFEQTVRTGKNRRRADRVIWAGLGRPPRKKEPPTVVVELVSEGKRDRKRDYEEKRDEYMAAGVSEYWIIDRFQRTMTVYFEQGGKVKRRLVREKGTYTTALLPGFELPLTRLLALADSWPEEAESA
jgi:Uma2 family endonuclease